MRFVHRGQWVGRAFSTLMVLLLLMDSILKIVRSEIAVKTSIELGYPDGVVFGIGLVLLLSTVLYAIPRTALVGAILLTGYLGGAVATHVRLGNPLFSHVLFPVYIGVILWTGLVLRDVRLRELIFQAN